MAVEIKDGKKILVTPVSAEDLKDIHIGDIVYLTGDITTCRDVAHRRVVEEGREIPVDVRDAAILHAALAYNDTDACGLDKFILKLFHSHRCRRAYGYHLVFVISQGADNRSGSRSGRNRGGTVERSGNA